MQVLAYLRLEAGQKPLSRVDDDHMLVRPDLLDLPGQLQTDRPGTDDQHPLGVDQFLVGLAEVVQRLAGGGGAGVGLGRVGVAGAGGQNQIVRLDTPA